LVAASDRTFMDTILDLDLDFFEWPPFRRKVDQPRLPESECRHLASPGDVRTFIEDRCHLSVQVPILGHEAEHHVDAFNVWGQWLDENKLSAPFDVVHVDAHSDLGSGLNRSCTYIETELLALPIADRRRPVFGEGHLNSGNYLLGAVANGWIAHLTYVYPSDPFPPTPALPGERMTTAQLLELNREELGIDDQLPPVSDLPAWIFRGDRWQTKTIELKNYACGDHRRYNQAPVSTEPPVPIEFVDGKVFYFSGFTHLFLARSPEYTTPRADDLLPIIRTYFHQI
jgi:hypothetical protein